MSEALGKLVANQGGIRSAVMLGFDVSRPAFIAAATALGLSVDGVRLPVYLASEGPPIASLWSLLVAATMGAVIGTVAGEQQRQRFPEPVYRRLVVPLVLALGVFLFRLGR